jgi:hypothetical protein
MSCCRRSAPTCCAGSAGATRRAKPISPQAPPRSSSRYAGSTRDGCGRWMSRAVMAAGDRRRARHSGAVRSTELWCAIAHLRISRFRVWSFGPSRNDGGESGASALLRPYPDRAHPPADSSVASDSIFKQPGVHVRTLATLPAPESCEIMSLERSRAQGRPGARNCTHGPRAKKVARARVDHR